MRAEFTLLNAKELDANLATLPKRMQNNVIRGAVREAQKLLVSRIQSAARSLPRAEKRLFAQGAEDVRMSELIARNVVVTTPRRQIRNSYALHVTLRRGVKEFFHVARGAHTKIIANYRPRSGGSPITKRGATVGVTYIPAAIEFGHGATKEAAARPFMRPAADATAQERLAILARQIELGLVREAMKGRSA